MKPHPYLVKLFNLGILKKEGGFALDLGCGDGHDSKFLIDLGYEVTSVDKESEHPGVVVTDIRDFIIEPGKYSFITCNNVLPFLDSQDEVKVMIKKMIDGLKHGGVVHFTLFGKNSSIKVPVYFTYQEIEDLVGSLDVEVYEKYTREGPGMSMAGRTIHSHVHTFILKKT